MELLKFVKTLASMCQHKGIHETWAFCGSDREFMLNWPTLMSLWQYLLVIPMYVIEEVLVNCVFLKVFNLFLTSFYLSC